MSKVQILESEYKSYIVANKSKERITESYVLKILYAHVWTGTLFLSRATRNESALTVQL